MHLAERLGYGHNACLLAIHADDMGCASGANSATFELMEAGLVTCGSVIVNAPQLDEVAAYQREHPEADIGVHLTLTSEHPGCRWAGVLGPKATPSLHDADGFLPMTVAQAVQRADPEEAARELRAQVELALERGIDVTHLDSHMGTIFYQQFLPAWTALATEFRLPTFIPTAWRGRPAITALEASGVPLIDELLHETYGPDRAMKETLYPAMLGSLQPGFNHFIVHPAIDSPKLRESVVGWETRVADYEILLAGSVQRQLTDAGVRLIGYRELRDAIRAGTLLS